MSDPTREELIALCERATEEPQSHWYDRDSASARMQVGQAWALLRAGCDFRVEHEPDDAPTISDANTWWVEITYEGFDYHEIGERSTDTFYIPTAKRLNERADGDWY